MRRRLALLASAVLLAAPSLARAQKPVSATTEYSPYEKETIQRALKSLHLELDPNPEGKTIESITTVRLEVLEPRDPVPEEVAGIKTRKLLNSLHYVSRDFVIRREMLLHEGDRYVQVLVDETARNMRVRMPLQISISIIVPVKGSTPDKVGLLVITKDIWSLRLSYNLSVTPGGVEDLLIVPQETNVLGWQHTASTKFELQPETYTLGAGYKIPRFGLSWVGASASANVVINRQRGTPEGSSAAVTVGQGLYSTRTPWAWNVDAGYSNVMVRRYVNARLATFDSTLTSAPDKIPFQYRSRTYTVQIGATRSFGWGLKNNFSITFNAGSASNDPGDLSAFDPTAVADFIQRGVPVGETRVYPALSWTTFTTNFLRTLDVNTLALQEDFRLGHDVGFTVYPITKALGSTRDVLGVTAHAGYSVPLGDGLVGASVQTVAEEQDARTITDGSVSGAFGMFTPRLGVGRLVLNATFVNRYRNYLRARTFLGGDTRLRGYPTNYFFGKDAVFYNVEFRSTSVEILKLQLGGVLFYDAGDAAQGFDMIRAKQSVGFGLRALIPQLNRLVFRFDFAFPMQRGPFPETGIATPVAPFGFFFTFDQAFQP